MKKLITLIGITTVLLSASNTSFAFSLFGNNTDETKINKTVDENANLKTITLDVPGMFCPTCPFTVRKSLEKLPGISEVKTSLKTRTAVVTYDSKKVSTKEMMKATIDAGYPSTVKNN